MKKVRMALALVTALVCALAMWACTAGGGKDFSLTSFEAEESVVADYGSFFAVPQVVAVGSDGADYIADIAVTDSNGNAVPVYLGTFQASDLGGYTITYTVTANGKTYTKTTSVTVADIAAPEVRITPISTPYEVGDKFVLPEIEITDLVDGNEMQPSEVYLKYVGEDATAADAKIAIPESGYEFTKLGDYEFHAVATDNANNSGESSVAFSVRSKPFAGEIDGFNDPYSPVMIHSGGNMKSLSRSFVREEIGGVMPRDNGYFLKIEAVGNVPTTTSFADVWLAPRFTKEQLAGWIEDGTFDSIEIRFLIEADDPAYVHNLSTHFRYDNQAQKTSFKTGVWNNFVIRNGKATGSLDKNGVDLPNVSGGILPWFLENYDTIHASPTGAGTFIYFAFHNAVTIYIDSIRLVKAADITINDINMDTTSAITPDDLGVKVSVGGNDVTADADVELLVSHEGDDYAPLGSSLDVSAYGSYNVVINVSSDDYAGCTETTLKKITQRSEECEYEYFNDDYWKASVSHGTVEAVPAEEVLALYPDSGDGAIQPGDKRYGGNFLKISANSDSGGFVNFFCAPHMSESTLRDLTGFNGKPSTYEFLTFRWLVHYENDAADCIRTMSTKYAGSDMWQRDYSANSWNGFGLKDTWETITFSRGDNLNTVAVDETTNWNLPHLAQNYSNVESLNASLFWFSLAKRVEPVPSHTAPAFAVNTPVTVYIQYISMASSGTHQTVNAA